MTRERSGTNGTVSATSFSPDGTGGGAGDGAALAEVGAGAGVGDGDVDASGDGVAGDAAGDGATDGGGDGATLLLANDCFSPAGISILVKYRKPPTPMAARHTTITTAGHIQLGAAWAGG